MTTVEVVQDIVARVNGIALQGSGAVLPQDELRQRAYTELLRQAAQEAGILGPDDTPSSDGVISETAAAAIEALLEQAVNIPEPAEEACLRYYLTHEAQYRSAERVRIRHVLFAVTPGVNVAALRSRAEATLLDVRCHDGKANDRFAEAARTWSNCPSGGDGGDLGWLAAADCAPEFARELYGRIEVGVLPRLVHSRFGLHVVEVLARDPGVAQTYEAVRGTVAMALRRATYVTVLRQYLSVLAGNAKVEGVDLTAADTPLVQ